MKRIISMVLTISLIAGCGKRKLDMLLTAPDVPIVVEVPKREEPSDFVLPGGNLIAITLGVLLVSSPFFISGYCMGWCGDGEKKTRPVRRRRHGYHLVNHHGHAIHGVVVGPNGLLPFPIIGANELG